MVVRVALNISLQGFVTTEDQTPEVSFGEDWPCLVAAHAATRTVRKCVFKDTSGEGTTGINDGPSPLVVLSRSSRPRANRLTLARRRCGCGTFLRPSSS